MSSHRAVVRTLAARRRGLLGVLGVLGVLAIIALALGVITMHSMNTPTAEHMTDQSVALQTQEAGAQRAGGSPDLTHTQPVDPALGVSPATGDHGVHGAVAAMCVMLLITLVALSAPRLWRLTWLDGSTPGGPPRSAGTQPLVQTRPPSLVALGISRT